MKSKQDHMPVEFKKAIEVACAIKSEYFFMNGGCAVFTALLAEVAQAKEESGTFHLIFRKLGGSYFLQHVCFNHLQSNDTYDIRGSNAQSRLIQPIIEHARRAMDEAGKDEDFIQNLLPKFKTDDIVIPSDTSTVESLTKLTDHFKLRTSSRWIDKSYEDLRRSVLEEAGLWGTRRVSS